eukprot:TRINITY_DN3557_c0_g1_i6.p1 TRINITY_DN3557_c0_g1~~TRINITY_DN3557_c0_g1_i6.p1  ORF type:complete len:363 (+),score=30.82 TRINITY_DN3557_c0_g1_i6:115-1089(+)
MCIRDRVSTQSTWGKFVSMSERRTAIVMLGDAGSGKTTLARAISTQRSELVVVDTPAIRGGQLGDIRALKALIHGLAGKTSVNAFTLRHLQLAERLFPGLWQHVIVVVSHWSERPPNLTERDIKASVSLRLRDSLSVLVPLPFLFTELVPIDSVEEFALRQTIDVITQFALTRSPYNLRALNQSALEDLRVREEAETESMSKRWSFRVVSLAVWLLLPTAAAFFAEGKKRLLVFAALTGPLGLLERGWLAKQLAKLERRRNGALLAVAITTGFVWSGLVWFTFHRSSNNSSTPTSARKDTKINTKRIGKGLLPFSVDSDIRISL